MTSPSKKIDIEKDSTMFGQLSNVEVSLSPYPQKQTSLLNKKLAEELELINRLKNDMGGIQKEAKQTSGESRVKLTQEVKQF